MLIAALLCSSLAAGAAAEADPPRDSPSTSGAPAEAAPPSNTAPAPGPFLGASFRHGGEVDLLPRFGLDLLAIPLGVPSWSADDWKLFGLYAGGVGLLMFLPAPSPDVQLQRWVRSALPRAHFTPWTFVGDKLIWGGVWGATLGALAYGRIAGRPELVEAVHLMLEAFAVAQVYHLAAKLVLGREGPENGQGDGVILGPLAGWKLFPAGTPSGHAATLYAMMGVVTGFWDQPVLTAALHLFGLLFCASLFQADWHYPSDLLWGAAMGYHIGRWVVRHRSTRSRAEPQALPSPVTVLPWMDAERGGYGLSFAFPL